MYSYKVLLFRKRPREDIPLTESVPRAVDGGCGDTRLRLGYAATGRAGFNAGQNSGLYPDEVVLRGLYQDRELAKQGLLDALHKYGCLPKRAGHKASLMSMTPTLNRGLQRYIADSNSALLGLQPEDWLIWLNR